MSNFKGFHVCKAGNAPVVGQTKTFIVSGDRIKSKGRAGRRRAVYNRVGHAARELQG